MQDIVIFFAIPANTPTIESGILLESHSTASQQRSLSSLKYYIQF